MAYKAINNAYATLAVAMSNTDTIAQVATGKGDLFPVITGTDHTYITLENSAGAIEIVRVTARALGSDSMTVVRGQDGTSAKSWLVGDIVECRPCAAMVTDLQAEFAAADAAQAVAAAISVTPVGNIASTNVQAALAELDTEKQPAGSYAALAGSSTQVFSAAVATLNEDVINLGQANSLYQPAGSYAALAGLATQLFSVAAGTAVSHAVNLGQFASSIAAIGYKKIPDKNSPSGFLIVQWGTSSVAASNADTDVTLPVAYPTGHLIAMAGLAGIAATSQVGARPQSLMAIRLNQTYTGGAQQCWWFSIGN